MRGTPWRPVKKIKDRLIVPTAAADDHQFRRLGAFSAHQFLPDLEQQQMIFARLDGTANDEIWSRAQFSIRWRRLRKNGRSRHRRYEDPLVVARSRFQKRSDIAFYGLSIDNDGTAV